MPVKKVGFDEAPSKIQKQLLNRIRQIVIQGYTEIVVGSPVATGRFRSNWQTSTVGRPQGTVSTTAYEPGQAISGDEQRRIEQATSELGVGGKEGRRSSIFITNNLEYAMRLENGHSAQNQGFVERAVRNIENRLKTI